jgi:hypothetical protein
MATISHDDGIILLPKNFPQSSSYLRSEENKKCFGAQD